MIGRVGLGVAWRNLSSFERDTSTTRERVRSRSNGSRNGLTRSRFVLVRRHLVVPEVFLFFESEFRAPGHPRPLSPFAKASSNCLRK